MRTRIALFGWGLMAALGALWPQVARGEGTTSYPYVAYVAVDRAHVHAGPGRAHYATDEVTRGMRVDVLRAIGDWLAIRPPTGSFCWIPAREAELTDTPDVAMILHDDVPAWIGTRIDREAEHVWQVQLNRGDRVKILDSKRRPGGAGRASETWYRIAPPAGELRFILAEAVSTEPVLVEDVADTDPNPPAARKDPRATPRQLSPLATRAKPLPMDTIDESEETTSTTDGAEEAEEVIAPAQFVPRGRSTERTSADSSATTTPLRATPASPGSPFREIGGNQDSLDPAARMAALDRLPPLDAGSLLTASNRFEDRLAELELQLSLLAARDPHEWRLEPLHAQAEQLLAAGRTTLERGRARLLLDKVQQFAALAERSQAVADLPRLGGITAVNEPSPPKPSPAEAIAQAEGLKLPDGVTYDGVGWLKPVYSAKRVAPPYALVDVDGKVLQYVTPTPGLNLNRYVKKPVGVFGQKSHLAEFKADHVTASKVVELTRYQTR